MKPLTFLRLASRKELRRSVFDVVVEIAEHFSSQERVLSADAVEIGLELAFAEPMSTVKNVESTFGIGRRHNWNRRSAWILGQVPSQPQPDRGPLFSHGVGVSASGNDSYDALTGLGDDTTGPRELTL